MKTWLFMINYFAHDFFSAFWLACFITLGIVHGKTGLPAGTLSGSDLGPELLRLFFWLQTASLVLIAITGYVRSLDTGGREALDLHKTKQFLIIKHIVLGILFVGGQCAGLFLGHALTAVPVPGSRDSGGHGGGLP